MLLFVKMNFTILANILLVAILFHLRYNASIAKEISGMKETKTNAMRILDKGKIPYGVLIYTSNGEAIDGV